MGLALLPQRSLGQNEPVKLTGLEPLPSSLIKKRATQFYQALQREDSSKVRKLLAGPEQLQASWESSGQEGWAKQFDEDQLSKFKRKQAKTLRQAPQNWEATRQKIADQGLDPDNLELKHIALAYGESQGYVHATVYYQLHSPKGEKLYLRATTAEIDEGWYFANLPEPF
jgi:hypothetical protein